LTAVRLTPRPTRIFDILSIASFIAQDSVPRAQLFIEIMRERCAKLAIFPTRGRRRPEYAPTRQRIPPDGAGPVAPAPPSRQPEPDARPGLRRGVRR
jgi:plasmid stabilization system protein ParE